jgi:hemerythrin-like metal-binding protein
MALIKWNQSFSVGVQSIDKQHTVLFDSLNELHASMMSGQAQNMTGPLLKKLLDYTRNHFSEEEKMMAAAKYPGLTDHLAKHRILVKQVEEYAARYEKGEITLNLHLLNFVRDWLTNHIQKTDKEYGPWMNEHGVK